MINKNVEQHCVFNFQPEVFNMVETPNVKSGLQVIGQFLNQGIQEGKKTALVSFQNCKFTLDILETMGFSFVNALEKEELFYFYYKTDFAEKLALSQDYESIFNEIVSLSDKKIDRIAFVNADLLLNSQSNYLTSVSIQKLAIASAKYKLTFLGQYLTNKESESRDIKGKCKKLLPSFYSLETTTFGEEIYDHSYRSSGVPRAADFIQGQGYKRRVDEF